MLAGHTASARMLASAGHDGDVMLWSLPDLAHCRVLRGLHAPSVRPAAGADAWMLAVGVSALSLMEDSVISTGFDGHAVVTPFVW